MIEVQRKSQNSSKVIYLLILLLILSIDTMGQVIFEKGYFIDNNDKKTECLIKNHDWKTPPNEIEYQLTGSSEAKVADVNEIKEFGVSGLKYRRFTVEIEQSSESISQMTEEKEPIFTEETLFLKVIIEGSASLFSAGKEIRYFYSVNNSEVAQLVHKQYLTPYHEVASNNSYKSQLYSDLKCSCITREEIKNTKYKNDALIRVFEKYNTCVHSDFINFEEKQKRDAFNLYLRPGLKRATLSIGNSYNQAQNVDYGSKLNFSIGFEAEFIFPFNKNKWAIFIEPTYQSYQAEKPNHYNSNSIHYNSIELQIGIKHSMYLNFNSKIFLSGGIVFIDIPFDSKIGVGGIEIRTSYNEIFGAGYCYKNKYSCELRYGTSRDIITSYVHYFSDYRSISLIFGYNIF
ncbi:MAG: hypothetical protein K9H64_09765 [Bacteroidales bacterium]|nr:hypothetical protein [Bacteroidales bacterium]MCF8456151.1 hypothetical protein [Bacteroidales bacterium]